VLQKRKTMPSILDRRFDQASTKVSTSNPSLVSQAGLREKTLALAPLAIMLVVVLGLAALITLSVMNNKLFFNELLVSAFIIIALMFFKTSAAPRK
jgi:hypothetical protein